MTRTEIDMVVDVLKASRISVSITRVAYDTLTNFTIAGKYLRRLVKAGLIQNTNNIYTTTEKGEQLIILIEKMRELLPKED